MADCPPAQRKIAVNAIGFIDDKGQRKYFDECDRGSTLHLVKETASLIVLLQNEGDLSVENSWGNTPYQHALAVFNFTKAIAMAEVASMLGRAALSSLRDQSGLMPNKTEVQAYLIAAGVE